MVVKVGIFFGGRSREREISFAGGRTVYDNLDKTLFQAVPIFVDSWGNFVQLDWHFIYKGSIRDFYPPAQSAYTNSAYGFQVYAESLGNLSVEEQEALINQIGKRLLPSDLPQLIDFAFLALHGIYGEDGSIQGLLQYLEIPYTASGILPSAIGMDKAFQRKVMQHAGFHTPPFLTLSRQEWLSATPPQQQAIFENARLTTGFPVVVKPANQGSSIGASIAPNPNFDAFREAVNHAFFVKELPITLWQNLTYDEKLRFVRELTDVRTGIGLPLIVQPLNHHCYHPDALFDLLQQLANNPNAPQTLLLEAYDRENEVLLEGFLSGKEFSCIVIRAENNQPIALPPTEIRKGKELFDYRSKYLAGLSSKITPINLPTPQIEAIQQACEQLFTYFKFHTYARIDGFINPDGIIYLNDPNTTSGMLPSSFFFHQAAEIGLNPSEFLTYIIRSSLQERINHSNYQPRTQALALALDQNLHLQKTQPSKKINVGVILGGYSSERHISVESGRNIYEKLASSGKYNPIPIFLTGNDQHFELYRIPINILLKDNADDIAEKINHFNNHPVKQAVKQRAAGIIDKFCLDSISQPQNITIPQLAQLADVVFIALHGRPGEDGNLQNQLEQYHIPYNGSSVTTSRITIDKYATLQLLKQHGIHTTQQLLLQKTDWEKSPDAAVTHIETLFSYPLIAKPHDDGCSSAVKKIKNAQQLQAYLHTIFRSPSEPIAAEYQQILNLKPKEEFPEKTACLIETLVEKGTATRFLEITGGLITHKNEQGELIYEVFEPSETLAGDEVLSLEEKFLAGEGQNITPARYSPNPDEQKIISEKVKADLHKVAQILNIEGYARTDAFVKIYPDNQVETFIIEVNSLPGMTPATCIFHQCAINNYTPYAFIDQILTYAMQKQQNKPAN